MPTNAERQRAFQERKRAEKDRREFDQFIINTSFSSSTTDVEKYVIFQSYRLAAKVNERKRKRALAARERRRKRKQERIMAESNDALANPTETKEVIRKRKRAEAARERRKKRKQECTASDLETAVSRNVRFTHAESNEENSRCQTAEAALKKRKQIKLGKGAIVEFPKELVVEPPVSMWLEDD